MAWEREDLGRGLSRMRRDLGDGVVLLASDAHWCSYRPDRQDDAIAVGSVTSTCEAMEAADEWAYEQGYRPERSEGER